MTMNPVVHFEMPAEDRKRMAAFYEKAFGWQCQLLGPEMGDYVVVTTTESDENGPKEKNAINGGFYPKKDDWPAQYPAVVIAVEDINKSMKIVTDAGGNVLGEPMEIPGIGQYVSFFDTEGNRVSMLQAAPADVDAADVEVGFLRWKSLCCFTRRRRELVGRVSP
ncbi:MAG: uncharacterized protein QOK37_3611 [Thermoanaerobaculia bacterium]|jgi:predicted enzyme related to lactoylglutathione lyase|nr:uncharacterized protein [Thermoanaerobaculia bacterium]